MKIGNVVKTGYGDIVIIKNVATDLVSWISFTSSNTSGGFPTVTKFEERLCYCLQIHPTPDPECEACKGKGSVVHERKGADQCEVLADNCAQYIRNRLLKNFDF